MKKERYIVEIEMPDGDCASSTYIHEVIQSDCDIEDEGRWKVSVKECWKPSDEQIKALETTLYTNMSRNDERYSVLSEFVAELKKLKA